MKDHGRTYSTVKDKGSFSSNTMSHYTYIYVYFGRSIFFVLVGERQVFSRYQVGGVRCLYSEAIHLLALCPHQVDGSLCIIYPTSLFRSYPSLGSVE